jgi:hypothetical protein
MGGLAACGDDDSAGPEAGGVTAEDLQQFEDDLGGLEERVGALESGLGEEGEEVDAGLGADDDTDAFFSNSEVSIGQEVTVSAEVSEMVTTTDVGSAYRIAGESGDPIAVVSATPIAELDANDVVRVTGTVVQVQRDTFEEDFGLAAGELFEDEDAWFEEEEGSVAISAERVEILQAAGQND